MPLLRRLHRWLRCANGGSRAQSYAVHANVPTKCRANSCTETPVVIQPRTHACNTADSPDTGSRTSSQNHACSHNCPPLNFSSSRDHSLLYQLIVSGLLVHSSHTARCIASPYEPGGPTKATSRLLCCVVRSRQGPGPLPMPLPLAAHPALPAVPPFKAPCAVPLSLQSRADYTPP
jgi:hypothetical protein